MAATRQKARKIMTEGKVSWRVLNNQEVWQALREIVPGLPKSPRYAVLRMDLHQGSLDWDQPQSAMGLGRDAIRWTKAECDRILHQLTVALDAPLVGWREIRIELRNLAAAETEAVEIQGRQLWTRDNPAESEESR